MIGKIVIWVFRRVLLNISNTNVDSPSGSFTKAFFGWCKYVKGVLVSVEGTGKGNLSCEKYSIKEIEFKPQRQAIF